MNYRRWTKADNSTIELLEKECFKTPWSKEMLDSCFTLENFYGIVALDADKIVGYIGCIFDNWDGQILNVAVSKEFRRKKIGMSLMQIVIEYLGNSNKEKVFLEVRRSNDAAKQLYNKLGFVEVGVRANYYENTEDALVLAKLLRGTKF